MSKTTKSGIVTEEEHGYLNDLHAYIAKSRLAHIEPAIERMLKRNRRETVDYDTAFRSFKRAVNEVARKYQSQTSMTHPIANKSARDRVHDSVTRAIMEIYLARARAQSAA